MSVPALRFEQEAFSLDGPQIMGRQSAGSGFLRAVVGALPSEDTVVGYGPSDLSAKAFVDAVKSIRADAKAGWVFSGQVKSIQTLGGVHFPDPGLGDAARSRLRVGTNAYSLTGVTHTLSSQAVMRQLADYAIAPLMPWDALVCTSEAVRNSVTRVLDAQEQYLAWRFSKPVFQPRLKLPVIPLGVHMEDFAFSERQRSKARRDLKIKDKEVAFLFLGRLSFHAKANPIPMYQALEAVSDETRASITLIQCGWFANEGIERAFKDGAKKFAPSIRMLWLDGRNKAERDLAWSASDVFMSLPDNIQETFGLTPIEAMAAGLPVIVCDWDGYRDTVRHGETGFRVPTAMPVAPLGNGYVEDYWNGLINYDQYVGCVSQHISVDMRRLISAATDLASNKDLRRKMGNAGREMARAQFSWAIILQRYVSLWSELKEIRSASPEPGSLRAVGVPAERLGPFDVFGSFSSQRISLNTRVRSRLSTFTWSELRGDALLGVLSRRLPSVEEADKIMKCLGNTEWVEVSKLAQDTGYPPASLIMAVSILTKLSLVEIEAEIQFT